uniref:2-iminobutanoate/2-iminopropanoate deaminase-like n=1 Tax=Dermatophagoides pteronyssinus TaxID=6956 RepID=A0A6P6XLQ4_DERPT|nr:2-iminobutanoate/2-iminopropanoate deaminase-like [Dermatophagoides pteronyssinus]
MNISFLRNFIQKSSNFYQIRRNFQILINEKMSPRRILSTPLAPIPIGPYSQAVQVGNQIYLSGQLGMNVRTGELLTESIQAEARQTFNNMKAVVESGGARMSDIVKLTIFIRDFNDFPIINDVMKEFFQSPFPARSTIGVASLPKNARIELECIAVIE